MCASPNAALLTRPDSDMIRRFCTIVGEAHSLRATEHDLTRYTDDRQGILTGATPLVLKPGNVTEVAAITRLAASQRIGLVPQGGLTGRVGGGVPSPESELIVVSTERLNKIRKVDPDNDSMTVEAGVILQNAQEAAEAAERLLPLFLASQGSCHIGGNIATNAGGIKVLAYGSMRDLVLGLEVVLADGSVWNGLKTIRKDNSGYALKHLFIGSEGTLGIITAATLRLFPRLSGREVAFIGCRDPEAALTLLHHMREEDGHLVAFELISRFGLELVLRHGSGLNEPLSKAYPWYVLMEMAYQGNNRHFREHFENHLIRAYEKDLIDDLVIAESLEQQNRLWALREQLPEAQKPEGVAIKHDIAVPLRHIPEFILRAGAAIGQISSEARICAFGHMGDGNIHYNVLQPHGGDADQFRAKRSAIEDAVYGLTIEMEGSISAEHGIGRDKRDLLRAVKSREEYALMRIIKTSLDPANIMNPGKIF